MLGRSTSLKRLVVAQRVAHIATTARLNIHQPNAPVEVDPSLQALLRDVDISIARHKAQLADPHTAIDSGIQKHRELEVFHDFELAGTPSADADEHDYEHETKQTRKSPAARFGSRQFGAVVLPLELQNSITRLIEGSDKGLLRLDAKRLFLGESKAEEGEIPEWGTDYETRYKSHKQFARHKERDGTAFASVALPSHYAAIVAVFDHIAHRLGPEWSAARVIDWHAGTGSGLWAATAAFQDVDTNSDHGPDLTRSTLRAYTAIDRREGLTAIGKRLLEDVDLGNLGVRWRKSLHEADTVPIEGGETVALSAFALSGLANPIERKKLVKEMWESGADIIVLIDHNTLASFEDIAAAREQLLEMGRKEVEASKRTSASAQLAPSDDEMSSGTEDTARVSGCYALAPCPHDGACPLWQPDLKRNKLACGFSQRLQRPPFVRRTKHSGVGHEDIGYSYVVIRRGQRPTVPRNFSKLGRLGQVGQREITRLEAKLRAAVPPKEMVEVGSKEDRTLVQSVTEQDGDLSANPSVPATMLTEDEMDASLRLEANTWPRLVFPPLKRSGHIILDVCDPSGQILRSTIPKSQGKQPYYDARKSEWGDIFPHAPKNKPQARFVTGEGQLRGGDIGKRGVDVGKEDMSKRPGYGRIAEEVKKRKNDLRRNKHKSKWDGGEDEI